MTILIENYRGWGISFDTQNEEFNCLSNEYDKSEKKKSFSSAKKYIDDYLKENQKFKPIKVQSLRTIYRDQKHITIIGIRKDGKFMVEDSKGKKSQLSTYDERDYFLPNEKNDALLVKINELTEKRNLIDEEISDLESKIIKFDVTQIRKNLLGT